MSLRIFIGFDSREAECSDILAYSLRAHSSIPLDIRYLDLRQLDFDRPQDPLQSTEFTYTRFLVPHLCDYEGKAIFMDCDMLCLGDIAELDELDMTELRAPRGPARLPADGDDQDGRQGADGLPAQELVEPDADELRQARAVDQGGRRDPDAAPICTASRTSPTSRSASCPKTWNTLDWMDEHTKLIHYTSGGPWFEECRDHPYGAVWLEWRDRYRAAQAGRRPAGGLRPDHARHRPARPSTRCSRDARSMALVGNADTILEHASGARIDGCDVVVRFNRAHVDGIEDKVGRRTDILVANRNYNLSKAPSPAETLQPRCVVCFLEPQPGIDYGRSPNGPAICRR